MDGYPVERTLPKAFSRLPPSKSRLFRHQDVRSPRSEQSEQSEQSERIIPVYQTQTLPDHELSCDASGPCIPNERLQNLGARTSSIADRKHVCSFSNCEQ